MFIGRAKPVPTPTHHKFVAILKFFIKYNIKSIIYRQIAMYPILKFQNLHSKKPALTAGF
ncbi:hypothetical protein B0182_00530 [Moraxella bovis]|nr:hypothetical protein DQF64_09295 [Moraxella bovis]OOR92529.1 hypothetical protein B0182_00530 [Moraxella bovis]